MSSFPFPVIKFLLLPLTIMTSLTATDWLIDRTSTQLTVCSDWQQQQQQQQTKTLHSFFSPHSGDFDPGTYSHRLTDGTFLRCCSCCWQNGILLLLCPLWMWLGLLQQPRTPSPSPPQALPPPPLPTSNRQCTLVCCCCRVNNDNWIDWQSACLCMWLKSIWRQPLR